MALRQLFFDLVVPLSEHDPEDALDICLRSARESVLRAKRREARACACERSRALCPTPTHAAVRALLDLAHLAGWAGRCGRGAAVRLRWQT